MNVGKYLNLMPHMSSWRVYSIGTTPTAGNEAGKLAPATFGGLSYRIVGNPSTNIYTIQTESYGTVNIFAPQDNDSSITNVPQFDNELNSTGSGDYLNLQPHMDSWRVYPVGVSPVSGNEVGRLAPSMFGGLSYRIIDNPSANLYTIETESFGRVNIFAPRDPDSTITNSPEFSNGGARGSSGENSGEFLNLAPHMDSWRVYPIGVNPVSGNEVGRLAPSRFGGLSYEILGQPSSNLYTILTESFGRVNIYAPRDNESTITSSPTYLDASDGSAGAIHGNYLNLMPHITSWRVYSPGVPLVAGNEVGKLGPSLFGGLTYRILGSVGPNSYTIETEKFGQVNIYAPRDNDSSITSSPLFGVINGNTAPGGGNSDFPIGSNPNGVKIFLDAGHGGFDNGATGNGLKEKEVNLTIVKELGRILAASGANIQYRRSYDTYNKLDEIVNMANNSGADLFISIHCNANPSPLATGTETYTQNASPSEFALSSAISQSISSNLGLQNRGAKENDFRVITNTNMPAILVETGFVSNAYDASLLRSQPGKFAQAIAAPIISMLGIKPSNNELSEQEKKRKITEFNKIKLDNFMEAYPVLKEHLDLSKILPTIENEEDATVTFDKGPFKVEVTISKFIKTVGSDTSKATVREGKIQGTLGTIIDQKLSDIGDFGVGLNFTDIDGFAAQMNHGNIQTAFGLTGNNKPKISLALNMPDQKVTDELETSLSIKFEVVFDPDTSGDLGFAEGVLEEFYSLLQKVGQVVDEYAETLAIIGLVIAFTLILLTSATWAFALLAVVFVTLMIDELKKIINQA